MNTMEDVNRKITFHENKERECDCETGNKTRSKCFIYLQWKKIVSDVYGYLFFVITRKLRNFFQAHCAVNYFLGGDFVVTIT